MALTAVVQERTANAISYLVTEAATAAATLTVDLPADLLNAASGGPLRDLIQGGGAVDTAIFADQAAARTALLNNCDVISYPRVLAQAGATGGAELFVDANVSAPAVAGNFRLEITSAKAANGDTGVFVLRLQFRHSISD